MWRPSGNLPVPIQYVQSSILNNVWVLSGSVNYYRKNSPSDEGTKRGQRVFEDEDIQTHNGETFLSRGEPLRELNEFHCNVKIDDHKVFLAPISVGDENRHFMIDLENYDDVMFVETDDNVLPYDDFAGGACGVSKNPDGEVIVVILKFVNGLTQIQRSFLYNVARNEFSMGPALPFVFSYFYFSTLTYQDTFLLFGGERYSGFNHRVSVREIFMYNRFTNTFDELGPKLTYGIEDPTGVLVPRDFVSCPGK